MIRGATSAGWRRLALACSLGLLAAAIPRAAAARPHEIHVSKKDDARAKELYHEGDRAYAEGRYEDAAAKFKQAYGLSPRPLLLFNLANAYERAAHYQKAVDALTRYLPHAEPGEKKVIQERLDNLKKRAERQAEQQQEAKQSEQQARQSGPPAPQPEPAPTPAAPPPRPAAPSSPPTAGYVLLGAGGAAIAAGVVFGVLALGARSDENGQCSSTGGQRLCTSAASDAISRDKRWSLLTDISVGAGVVAAGVGAYLLIGHRGSEKTSASARHFVGAVGASTTPGGGELKFVGLF